MDALKKFLLEHGEKILLAVIALFCGSSIYSHISRPKDQLILPNGKTKVVDSKQLQQRLKEVNALFSSNKERQEKPEAAPISRELVKSILAEQQPIARQERLEWFAYNQPSPIGIPQAFREAFNADEQARKNIPAEYRTRLGNAEEIKIRTAVGKVVIVAKDSQYTNFPQPKSRQMLVYRKAIGSAKDGLSLDIRAKAKNAPRDVPLAVAEGGQSQEETSKSVSGMNASSLWGSVNPVRNNPDTEKTPAPEFSRAQYEKLCNDNDLKADQELTVLIGNNDALLLENGWELVTDSMMVVKNGELSEDDIAKIFIDGLTPEMVEMNADQLKEYEKQNAEKKLAEEKKKKIEAPDIAKSNVGVVKGRVKPKAITVNPEPTSKDVAEDAENPAPRQYVYIDTTVKENMIYRYAVLAAVKPQKPNEEDVPGAKKWDIYCELAGIDKVGCFAPPQRELQGMIFETPAKDNTETSMALLPELKCKHDKGVVGPRLLSYIKPAYDTSTNSDNDKNKKAAVATEDGKQGAETAASADNGPLPREGTLRNESRKLTSLGWAYRNQETCFADLVYSDLVLTPSEYDFALKSSIGPQGGRPASAYIDIIKIEKTGETFQASFQAKMPENISANAIIWKDFLVKGADGKPVEPVKYLSLTDVYNRADWKKVIPVAFGGKKKVATQLSVALPTTDNPENGAPEAPKDKETAKAPQVEVDFGNSGWGLLDVRPYKVRQTVFTKTKSGEWKKTGELLLPSKTTNYYSVVIAESKALRPDEQRRVRRLFMPLKPKVDTATKKYHIEYVEEYELEEKIKAREKQKAAKANAAQNKAAPGAANGKKTPVTAAPKKETAPVNWGNTVKSVPAVGKVSAGGATNKGK